jgi:hypothetical protein
MRTLMRESHQVFDLLSTLDPLLASRSETEAALARFQQRFAIQSIGSVQQYDGDLDQEELPLIESEWNHPPVIPKRSSTRLRRMGVLAQTLAAVLVVTALIGSFLLLFQHRLPSTAYHPTSATQTYANPNDRVHTPTTVEGLTKKWAYQTVSSITTSPTVAGGLVYIGCGCGYAYALDATTGAKK